MSLQSKQPTYDEYFREFAFVASKRSPCQLLQTGCVIVKDNRMINQAHNTYLTDEFSNKMMDELHDHFTASLLEEFLVHAEQNALSDCARRGISCENATIYCTHMPCIHCIRSIIASGIKSIKYHISYNGNTIVPYMCELSSVTLECLDQP